MKRNVQKTRRTYAEKRAWVLGRLTAMWEDSCRTSNPPLRPFICGMEPDDQEAWEAEFGGQVKIYTVGPNVSPDFARTLRRMWMEGDLARSVGGNQEALANVMHLLVPNITPETRQNLVGFFTITIPISICLQGYTAL